MSLAATQRGIDVRASLQALQDEGFVQSWHERYGATARWSVTSLHVPRLYTTREVELFIRGAKCVLFDPRVVAMLEAR